MKLTKLSWSGVKVETSSLTILIDAVEDFSGMEPYMGRPVFPVHLFSEETRADVVLLTHLHPDHYDKEVIKKVLKPRGVLLTGAALSTQVNPEVPGVTALQLNEPMTLGDARFTALYAMDGIGDEQVSWLIEAEGFKVFHGGDTIWHNKFWKIGKEHGPIDLAFLPINGVRVNYPFVGYTPLPASLLPEQAAVAARIMGVTNLVPMHYGQFHSPPVYCEYAQAQEAFEAACRRHHQSYTLLLDGESIHLQPLFGVHAPSGAEQDYKEAMLLS